MAQFVNYGKRGFTLPPGCKDLIDVLVPTRRTRGAPSNLKPFYNQANDFADCVRVKVDRFPEAGLAQVERYVTMVIQSGAETFALSMTMPGLEFPVTLYHSKSEQTDAIVVLTKKPDQEQNVRAFFGRQGLGILYDSLRREVPDGVFSLVCPLPSNAEIASQLTKDLLRSVYGLTEESGIDFQYHETRTAA
jgi:hypothetical protein